MAKSSNKIRINLRAYEHNVLDAAAVRIVEVAKNIKMDTIFFLTGKEFYESN